MAHLIYQFANIIGGYQPVAVLSLSAFMFSNTETVF